MRTVSFESYFDPDRHNSSLHISLGGGPEGENEGTAVPPTNPPVEPPEEVDLDEVDDEDLDDNDDDDDGDDED